MYRDKDFDVQEVINRLPSKFTIEKEQELLPKGVNIKIHKYSINCAVSLFSNGTNGAEGCIINSMEDVLNVLKNLRKYKGVNWSQLLEVGIDNADDLYWWYVTFSIDTTAI